MPACTNVLLSFDEIIRQIIFDWIRSKVNYVDDFNKSLHSDEWLNELKREFEIVVWVK